MTTPTDADLIQLALEDRLLDVWTCLPGYVAKVYADRGHQYVDVIPAVSRPIRDENGDLTVEALPQLIAVPVAFPQGGGFFLSLPMAVGDVVTVVFAQWSLDQWTESGQRGASEGVAAAGTGIHGPAGAIAFPCGPMPRTSLLKDVSPEKLIIARDGAERIEMGGEEVKVICPKITLDGEVTVTGDVFAKKNLEVDENTTVKGDVAADGEVTAVASGQSVGLSTHTHPHPFGETASPRPGT